MVTPFRVDHSFAVGAPRGEAEVRFCSRCGESAERPPRGDGGPLQGRVCPECGMGMLLRCERDALPAAGAAFLIARADLRVSAISETGEYVFGAEATVLGMRLLDLVTSPMGDARLGRAVTQAATRRRDPVSMPVRAAGAQAGIAGMMAARISPCGSPRAALVAVEPSDFGRH